jgi:archaellum component FlaC
MDETIIPNLRAQLNNRDKEIERLKKIIKELEKELEEMKQCYL